MELLSGCFDGAFMVDKDRAGADGGWFGDGAKGSAIASVSGIERLMAPIMATFYSTSSGEGVINTGRVIRSGGDGGAALAETYAGNTVTTVLAAIITCS